MGTKRETKEGRIRWSVEVMTTEANPAEEKPVEHEDGLDWTIDECYVSYYCKYKGKDFCLITYEMLKTARRELRKRRRPVRQSKIKQYGIFTTTWHAFF